MFVSCGHCRTLVATDPVTDLPPARCPRCNGALAPSATASAATPAAPDVSAKATGAAAPAPVPPAVSVPRPAPPARMTTPVVPPPAPSPAAGPVTPAPAPALTPPPSVTAMHAPVLPDPAQTPAWPLPAAPAVQLQAGTLETLPTQRPQAADAPVAATPTALVVSGASLPTPPAAPAPSAPISSASAGGTRPPLAPRFLAQTAPGAASTARGPRWRRPLAIGVLALLLAGQVLLADRERHASDPQWRPLVASLCSTLGCSLPPWREPAAFVLLSREVRPHPEAADALQVRASFRNDARWAQAWPQLLLTLSDVDGRAVGARAFSAGEYLGQAPDAALVAPGQTVDIALDIREPRVATVSYAFDFR